MKKTWGIATLFCLCIINTFAVKAQVNALLPKGSCGNPYIITDSLAQINVEGSSMGKVWFTFVSEANDFFINLSNTEGQTCNYMIFRYTGHGFCDSIAKKKLISERNKVCDLEILTDAAMGLSYENINRGVCACSSCCVSHTIFKGRARERYMIVVYKPENIINVHLHAGISPYEAMPEEESLEAELTEMANLEVGATIVLDNIYFRPGNHDILPNSYPTLNKLYEFLLRNSAVTIDIQGHVNAPNERPDITHSGNLAGRRARAVHDYLVTRGINNNRLTYKGLGNTQMIYPTTTIEREMAKNRRVEIVILSK